MPTQEGVLKARLVQVGYCGDPVGCTNWTGTVELEVLPNGLPYVTSAQYFNINAAPGGPPEQQFQPPGDLYQGPGGFHGAGLPEAILNFRVSVSGQDGSGLTYEGATEALIPHASSDWIHPQNNYFVSVPLSIPPSVTPPRVPPSLWFNFSVATVC